MLLGCDERLEALYCIAYGNHKMLCTHSIMARERVDVMMMQLWIDTGCFGFMGYGIYIKQYVSYCYHSTVDINFFYSLLLKLNHHDKSFILLKLNLK